MNSFDLPQHSYEEIREAVVEILLTIPQSGTQWVELQNGVGNSFAAKEKRPHRPPHAFHLAPLHPQDMELMRDVFWDLFRQGFITLGANDNSPIWPFFRLSHFGQKTLAIQSPYRFHDATSFLSLVHKEIPDISPEAVTYLDEAVSTFYAGCLLASCVTLGVAAEIEFLRLVEVATKSPTFATKFSALAKAGHFIRPKITKFQQCLTPLMSNLPQEATEDLETNLSAIQSVLRIARNDAGHPTGVSLQREQVYVYLQLFVPFARQLMRLRQALA